MTSTEELEADCAAGDGWGGAAPFRGGLEGEVTATARPKHAVFSVSNSAF